MNRFKTILSATLALMLLVGCSIDISGRKYISGGVNNGDISKATVKKSVKISNFDEIKAVSGIQIEFTQGKFTGTAEITTTPSAEQYLVVTVKDKTLSAYYKNHTGNIDGPTIIRVQAPQLEEISLTSAAQVNVNGLLTINKELEINLTSASQVKMGNVSGGKLEIDLTSASNVKAEDVNVTKLDVSQTSASTISFTEVTAQELEIGCTSASKASVYTFNGGNADISVTSGADVTVSNIKANAVEASATSGGNITLVGYCNSLTERSSSGGSISTRKLTKTTHSSTISSKSSSSKKTKVKSTKTKKSKVRTSTSSSSDKVLPREP